jgi:hypothetical protein
VTADEVRAASQVCRWLGYAALVARAKPGEAVPSPSFERSKAYAHQTPGRLPVWSFSGDILDLLLMVSELQHSARLRKEKNPAFIPRYARGTQDAQGVVIRWAYEYEAAPPSEEPASAPSRRDLGMASDAVDLAFRWSQLCEEDVAVVNKRGNLLL